MFRHVSSFFYFQIQLKIINFWVKKLVRERSQITAKIFIMTMSHADSHKLEYVFGLKFGVYYQIFTPSLLDDSRRIWRSFALCTIESLLYPSCFRWMAIISPFQICIRKVRYCVHWQVNFQTINNRKSSFLSVTIIPPRLYKSPILCGITTSRHCLRSLFTERLMFPTRVISVSIK